jgi:hypothetical protein
MSVQAHIAELEKRREALKKEIEEEFNHAACDDQKVADLKRRKLQIKDEIEKLKREAH